MLEEKEVSYNLQNAVHHLRDQSNEQVVNKKNDPMAELNVSNINQLIDGYTQEFKSLNQSKNVKNRPQIFSEETKNVEQKQYTEAFLKYLRKGDMSGFSHMEQKSIGGSLIDNGNGFLITQRMSDIVSQIMNQNSIIRNLASSVQISTNTFDAVSYDSAIDCAWSGDKGVANVSDSFSKKSIKVHELTTQPKLTQQLIDDCQIDLESWLGEKLANVFLDKENDAFINGDGNNMPKGILSTTNIEKINSGDAANITIDGLMKLYYSLEEKYNNNSAFIMNKSTIHAVRTMKDQAGQYLWMPGVLSGKSDTLLGMPLYSSNNIPSIAANANVALFGDFSQAYQVVDRDGIRGQRDPFTAKPFVIFYATKRVGGDVINSNAIKILKIAA